MNSHHESWLKAHPNRSEEWFAEKLKEGFDVHHLDGDHENDDPANLVLIEHSDHMMLHGMTKNGGRALGRLSPSKRSGRKKKPVFKKGKRDRKLEADRAAVQLSWQEFVAKRVKEAEMSAMTP